MKLRIWYPRPDRWLMELLLPMTVRSRIILSILSGLIIGTVTTYSIDFGYLIIPAGKPLGYDLGYVGTWTLLVWLTLSLWFFVFVKWVQGKDLANKLKLLEIRKLEMQIAIVEEAHPNLKLPEL